MSELVSGFPIATVTDYYKPSSLKQYILLSQSFRGWKSKVSLINSSVEEITKAGSFWKLKGRIPQASLPPPVDSDPLASLP